jgi:hypothetical protein
MSQSDDGASLFFFLVGGGERGFSFFKLYLVGEYTPIVHASAIS